jgi:hypothetical protein
MDKEFGRLTADQLRQLVGLLPVIDELRAGYFAEVRRAPELVAQIIPDGLSWAHLYERPFEAHLGILLEALGTGDFVRSAARADDPQQVVIDAALAEARDLDSVNVSLPEGVTVGHVLALLMSVDRSLECLLVFGRYLNELVVEARAGDRESLFKAVQIDPSAVASPSIAARIGGAVALGDERFLKDLGTALKGRTKNFSLYLRKLRYAIQLIREAGIETMSDAQLVDLFAKTAEVWDPSGSANPAKAIREHWNRSKRKSTA